MRNSFSKISERNGRFNIGQKFFIFFGPRFGFFKRSFITATFSEFGTHPVDRNPFVMFNIGGPSTGSSSFSSFVGIGYSMQVEGLEAITIFISVSKDIELKTLSVSFDPRSWQCCADSGQLTLGEILRFKEESVICFLIIIIFYSKKFMNVSLPK